MKNGLMGLLLRYPYEVRNEDEYFDDIQDVKVTKEMLDLAKHIVEQKSGEFDPEKFEDRYETALTDLINAKRAGTTIKAKARPTGENVVDLMDALKRSISGERTQSTPQTRAKPKRSRKTAPGQKEMLLPIAGKGAGKQAAKAPTKPAATRKRKTA
jgi:DNA end-binding protein Ku